MGGYGVLIRPISTFAGSVCGARVGAGPWEEWKSCGSRRHTSHPGRDSKAVFVSISPPLHSSQISLDSFLWEWISNWWKPHHVVVWSKYLHSPILLLLLQLRPDILKGTYYQLYWVPEAKWNSPLFPPLLHNLYNFLITISHPREKQPTLNAFEMLSWMRGRQFSWYCRRIVSFWADLGLSLHYFPL